jgi:hypothetical protein
MLSSGLRDKDYISADFTIAVLLSDVLLLFKYTKLNL